jgi:hypothetical protein
MGLLTPNWEQSRPTWEETRSMCSSVQLTSVRLDSEAFESVLSRLRESHSNGGAYLAVFQVADDPTFDWFASRNRLLEDSILSEILSRPEIGASLSELEIPQKRGKNDQTSASCPVGDANGFKMESSFLFDGHLAHRLFYGGAYWQQHGDGQSEKQMAIDFCRAAFDLRFSEMLYYISYEAWTSWFSGIAWDLTAILFDQRTRNLWVLAVTDTD